MRQKIFTLLVAILAATSSLFADGTKIGDLYYNLDSSTKTATVTYKSYDASTSSYNSGWTIKNASIPASVTSQGVDYSVTSIGYGAFCGCSSLTSVTIPNSVTSIESRAFRGCASLTSVTIPHSVTSIEYMAFAGCLSLTSVIIPNSVTGLDQYTFENVPNIIYDGTVPDSRWGARCVNGYVDGWLVYDNSSKINLMACSAAATGAITLPNSVTSIGRMAFYYCTGLTSVMIPNGVTSIGERAFYNCTSLTSVTIPNSVTSIGNSAFYGCTGLTSVTIPNSVIDMGFSAFGDCDNLPIINNIRYADTYLVGAVDRTLSSYSIKEGTRWIGRDAFHSCSNLASITIPNSVTSIEMGAFEGCSSLNAVYVSDITAWCNINFYDNHQYSGPSSNPLHLAHNLYLNNELVTDLVIPSSVTSIGDYAFYNCTCLTAVTIPNSVTSIGEYAFYGCDNLPVIDNLRYADTYLVGAEDRTLSSYTIKEGTKWIGDYAFLGCTGLTSITIPDNVTNIGNLAFYGCSNLTSITIPNNVTNIGEYAFYECTSLTSITIGNSVRSIGTRAFIGCRSLNAVYISDIAAWCNIKFSGSNTPLFYAHNLYLNNELVTDLVIPNGVTSIGDYTFYICTCLTSVTIPNSVTSIGEWAFYECTNLTSATIGNSVTSIGEWAFAGCTGLISITIGNSVTSIEMAAFVGCYGLTSVTIPNSVTSIGYGAFGGCTGLTSVYNYASTPQVIKSAFAEVNTSACTLYVPIGSVDAYKAADEWKDFGNIIGIHAPEGINQIKPSTLQGESNKIILNGQIFIIHRDKTYTITGQEVR